MSENRRLLVQKSQRLIQNDVLLAQKSLLGEHDMLLDQNSQGLGENDELLLQIIDRSRDKMISCWRKNRKVKAKKTSYWPKN